METSSASTTSTADLLTEPRSNEPDNLVLRLRRAPAADRPRVTWAADVIDNENLGRRKLNCCCFNVRSRQWDDPTTWEQDEAETKKCRGQTLAPPRKSETPGSQQLTEDDTTAKIVINSVEANSVSSLNKMY